MGLTLHKTGPPSSPSKKFRQQFQNALLLWFDANKRDLPWRADSDPYHIWVSEIMLQQTRVAVVVGYYERFMRQFPDIRTLARAREGSVLTAWSGLGYYRRARALHATAKVITREFDGKLPETAKELQRLPGIGKYTAAAIASIAFGEPCAVVDGNVERVLGRALKIQGPRTRTWNAAQEMLSRKRPGDFNQAMMELGATICTPVKPRCNECPVSPSCETRGPAEVEPSGVRNKKDVTVALATMNGQVRLMLRPTSGNLMPAMWELPPATEDRHSELLFKVRHSITNTDYRVSVVRQMEFANNEARWVRYDRIKHLPLTGLTRKVLRKVGIIE